MGADTNIKQKFSMYSDVCILAKRDSDFSLTK